MSSKYGIPTSYQQVMPFEILQRRESRRHRPLKLPGSSSPPVISASNSGAAKTSKTLQSAAENQTDPKQESTSSSTNGPVYDYLVDVAQPQFPRERIFQSLGKWYGTRQLSSRPDTLNQELLTSRSEQYTS